MCMVNGIIRRHQRLSQRLVRLRRVVEMVYVDRTGALADFFGVADETGWCSHCVGGRGGPDVIGGLGGDDGDGAFGLERGYGVLEVVGEGVDDYGGAAVSQVGHQ